MALYVLAGAAFPVLTMRLRRISAAEIPLVDISAILRYAPEYDIPWVLRAVEEGRLAAYRLMKMDGEAVTAEGVALLGVDLGHPRQALLIFGLAVHGRGWRRPLLSCLRYLASRLGCQVIRGVSPRRGWARVARPVGVIWEVSAKES